MMTRLDFCGYYPLLPVIVACHADTWRKRQARQSRDWRRLDMASAYLNNSLAIKSTRFFMKFTGFWIWNDRRSKIIMDLSMIYTIIAIFVALSITGSDLWFSRNNFYLAAYAACNAMTVLTIVIKLAMFTIKRYDFVNLIKFCYDNFWIEFDYDSSFSGRVMRECETKCIFFVGTFTFFAQCTVFTYALHPILENLGKNETDRILPFAIWLDIPITTTPYFEIMFTIEILSLIHSGICYFCFDNLLCIMNVHAAGQFRILQRRLENVCSTNVSHERADFFPGERKISIDDKNEGSSTGDLASAHRRFNELKSCVQQHRSLLYFAKKVDSVYTLVILGQIVVFSVLICLVSYQAVLADGSLPRRMIFVVHSAGTFTQLFMFTLTCHDLMRESQEVADAAYRARWYCCLSDPAYKKFGKDLMFVIMRARRPCCLTAGGFFPISLETFTTILSTAMSYLTLLRKGQDTVS